MNANEIIKEIDPDYRRCWRCRTFRHESELERTLGLNEILFVCKDKEKCKKTYNENQTTNQRT